VTWSVYQYKGCELKVDRIKVDIERTKSLEDYTEIVSSATYAVVSWRKLAGYLYSENRYNTKKRLISFISSTYYILDPRIGCLLLLKCRKVFEVLYYRLKINKWRDR
jgi:hypothetical protein